MESWSRIETRYANDSFAQFILLASQLERAVALLRSPEIADQRLSLIVIDNLAEVLLHRRKKWILALGDAPVHGEIPRLDDDQLNRFVQQFGYRVEVARMSTEHALLIDQMQPMLDETDALVFHTAHAYRNRAYHADHHNEALLPLLASEYALAVGRAFVRMQPLNSASSMSNAEAEQLARFGYSISQSESDWAKKMFQPANAAETVVATIAGDLEQTLHQVRVQLIADLVTRLEWCDGMIDTLLADGMDPARFAHTFRWHQFWSAARTDPIVVACDREKSRLQEASFLDGQIAERFEEESRINDKRNARISELSKEIRVEFDSGSIAGLLKRVRKLQAAETRAALFSSYRKIDEVVERLEAVLEGVATGWDQRVDSEVTRMREEAAFGELDCSDD